MLFGCLRHQPGSRGGRSWQRQPVPEVWEEPQGFPILRKMRGYRERRVPTSVRGVLAPFLPSQPLQAEKQRIGKPWEEPKRLLQLFCSMCYNPTGIIRDNRWDYADEKE